MGNPSYEDLMDLYRELESLDVNQEYVFTTAHRKQITLKRTQ